MDETPLLPSAKRAAPSDEGGPGTAGRGWLRRRATLRPDLRAAIALEEAGELLEAARVFEYAGEHGQAALLRLECARTLRDRGERIDVLREGCARNPAGTPEARLLHLALAEALLAEVELESDPATARAHKLEAARALDDADEGARAGEIYEELGLLVRAAAAYERGGEIARLELVLAVLEHEQQRHAAARAIEQEFDAALAGGRRSVAQALLHDQLAAERKSVGIASPGLVARLERLERRRLRGDRVDVRWGGGRTTRILGASELRIGRAPDAGLSLPQASLSREHVALRLDASGERTEVVALDLGSKIGSFWDGEPLRAGEPQTIAHSGELALGTAAAVRVTPLRSKDGHAHGAVIEGGADARPLVWLPQGGPLWLDASIAVPARVLFERGHVAIDFRAGVRVDLDGHALEPGACIELLLGDRIALHGAPLVLEVLG